MEGDENREVVHIPAAVYCEECRDYFPVDIYIDKGDSTEAPQLYIRDLHVCFQVNEEKERIQTKILTCLFLQEPEKIIELLNKLKPRAARVQREEKGP